MHDIFISYSHQDHEWVAQLAAALEAQGYDVWWDRELLASQDYAERIEIALNASRCIVTVWSPESVQSRWVRAESGRGFNEDKLVPVLKEEANIPIPFDSVHTADLRDWTGDVNASGFVELRKALEWRLSSQDQQVSGVQPTVVRKKKSLVPQQKDGMSWVLVLGLLTGIAAGVYWFMTAKSVSTPETPTQGLLSPPKDSVDPVALAHCEKANARESIIQASGRGHIDRVRECLDWGVDVNLKDKNQWAALHAAAHSGHLAIVKLLVSRGADIHAEANVKRTALYLAVMNNNYQVVHYLKSNGAAVNKADASGQLPFARAKTNQMKKLLSE